MELRVEHKSLHQGAVEALRNAILSGVFQPGTRLVESRLCEKLGISRTSLREALRSLEAERLIESIPNRGPQVPVISWEQARELYQVRSLLEGEIAALCAENATPADISELEIACRGFKAAADAGDLAGCLSTTADFYTVIMRSSGNKTMEQILTGLHARVMFLRGRSMSLKGRTRYSLSELRAILSAIRNKDPVQARKAAQDHVREACRAASVHFGQESAPSGEGRRLP